jgi:hypothetical protein
MKQSIETTGKPHQRITISRRNSMKTRMIKNAMLIAAGGCLPLVGLASTASAQSCTPIGWDTTFASGHSGLTGGNAINAMVIYDDGTGPALYAAGVFTSISGTQANSIAKFDPVTNKWQPLGSGVSQDNSLSTGKVYDIEVFDFDGAGPEAPKLVVVGQFLLVNGGDTTVNNTATWDGTTWEALGTGVQSSGFTGATVRAIEVHDDGTGKKLYIGGEFTINSRDGVAFWNGSQWAPLGGGLFGGAAFALKSFDDGSGSKLYIGGSLTDNLQVWDGSNYSTVGGGTQWSVQAFEIWDDDGAGPNLPALYGYGTGALTKWDGSTITRTVIDPGGGRTDGIAVYDDGTGSALYMGPNTDGINGRLFKYDGTTAVVVGEGFRGNADSTDSDYTVTATFELLSYDSGNGPELWIGGYFVGTDSFQSNGIMRWDGTALLPANGKELLGQDPTQSAGASAPSTVNDSLVFDPDGNGPLPESLYVAGTFETADGGVARHVAKYDGSSWSEVGGGIFGLLYDSLTNPTMTGYVNSLRIFDDGTGPTIYASAVVSNQETVSPYDIITTYGVYKLDLGTDTWVQLGDGFNQIINDMGVYNDGSGDALYAIGRFSTVGGVGARGFAKWTGTQWEEVGGGFNTFINGGVVQMEVVDLGGGEEIYLIGSLNEAGGTTVNRIAAWNGTSFRDAGAGLSMFPDQSVVAQTKNGPMFAVSRKGSEGGRISVWNQSNQLWENINIPVQANEFIYVVPTNSTTVLDEIWIRIIDLNFTTFTFDDNGLISYDGTPTAHPELGMFTVWNAATGITQWDGGVGPALWFNGDFAGYGGTYSAPMGVEAYASTGLVPLLCEAPPCPADMTGDGSLNFFDVSAFLSAFSAGDAAADFTGDGQFNFFDVSAFLSAFSAGCP